MMTKEEPSSTPEANPAEAPPSYREAVNDVSNPPPFKHTLCVWCVFVALCLLSLISAIDATIVTTSPRTITGDLDGATDYIWIANSFLFASIVPQPFSGQIANIFGRRNPMLLSIFLFAFGNGIAGAATSPGMLIASRTVQGLGTGGLYVLSNIIICDMIPPRHRGPYLSAVLSTTAIGTTIGPTIGGALALTNWRCVFWINLPIFAVGLAVILLFLNVKYTRSPMWLHALKRVAFLGNAIFIPFMVAIFFGLIMGGTRGYPWSSWRVILPLVLGVSCLGFSRHLSRNMLIFARSIQPSLAWLRTSQRQKVLVF